MGAVTVMLLKNLTPDLVLKARLRSGYRKTVRAVFVRYVYIYSTNWIHLKVCFPSTFLANLINQYIRDSNTSLLQYAKSKKNHFSHWLISMILLLSSYYYCYYQYNHRHHYCCY